MVALVHGELYLYDFSVTGYAIFILASATLPFLHAAATIFAGAY